MKIKLLTVAMLSTTLFLTACGGDDNESTVFVPKPEIPENNIKNPVVTTPTAYTKSDFSTVASQSLIMTYRMLGQDGKETMATSLVFVPNTPIPTGGWKIVAWAHGTTGVADQCAPSRKEIDSDVKSMISKLLAAGYVVVAPDYEGLGEPSGHEFHPFLNIKSEAFSVTDAVVATRAYMTAQGEKMSDQWMTVGHSQGGQAALGVAQYESRAKLKYKGTIAVAPASNLQLILEKGNENVANASIGVKIAMYAKLDTYTALITAGLRNSTSIQYQDVFKASTDTIAQKAETLCADELGNLFGAGMQVYAQDHDWSLDGYPRAQANFTTIPIINNFLTKDSQPLQKKITTPIIIYQGTLDSTVPKSATDLLIYYARAVGTSIPDTNYRIDNWDHGTAYGLNIDNIVNDVKATMPVNN
ncbi:alpha/beta fold hydrolase [Acinetobacter modestus]|uniref:alpha/beta fold hydrolase n=1 Tax=Acinetobacter modestus TaxID=1776740 RepID=UPI003207B2F6